MSGKDQLFQVGGFLCQFNVRLLLRKENQKVGKEELSYSFNIVWNSPPPHTHTKQSALLHSHGAAGLDIIRFCRRVDGCYLFFILIIS